MADTKKKEGAATSDSANWRKTLGDYADDPTVQSQDERNSKSKEFVQTFNTELQAAGAMATPSPGAAFTAGGGAGGAGTTATGGGGTATGGAGGGTGGA